MVSAALAASAVHAAPAPTAAVFRTPTLSWIVPRATINGTQASRAFTAYQVSLPPDATRPTVIVSVWFANCDADTLAYAGGSESDEDLSPGRIMFPPGGPGHQQVISSNSSPAVRQVADAVCGVGAAEWAEAPDLRALVKLEVERLKRR